MDKTEARAETVPKELGIPVVLEEMELPELLAEAHMPEVWWDLIQGL